jgi:hypothetical protein
MDEDVDQPKLLQQTIEIFDDYHEMVQMRAAPYSMLTSYVNRYHVGQRVDFEEIAGIVLSITPNAQGTHFGPCSIVVDTNVSGGRDPRETRGAATPKSFVCGSSSAVLICKWIMP